MKWALCCSFRLPLRLRGAEGAHRRETLLRLRIHRAHDEALEALGHAVEYLVDSRLFDCGDHNYQNEQEAVQILMRMSRAVFAECPEVVSLKRRVGRWVSDQFAGENCVRAAGN